MGNFSPTAILCALLLSVKVLKSLGGDTLFPNQTISVGQTLVSSNHDFEMGFFTPGKSPNRFLGIWYRGTPDVVVWVANRNNPIAHSQGITFAISGNGSLAISSDGAIIWSENSVAAASYPVLQLLDTGNLVVLDRMVEEDATERYLWQSFDYPTDNILPGMKFINDTRTGVATNLTSWRGSDDPSPGDFVFRIENRGMPELTIYSGNVKIFRSGIWNGIYFCGLLPFPHRLFNPEFVFIEGRLISIVEPYDSSTLMRSTLDKTGFFLRYIMNDRRNKWNLVITTPRDSCDVYDSCGPNGICSVDKPLSCDCLEGFAPRFRKEWDLQDRSGGCTRIAPLNCENGDGFKEVRQVKYPDMLKYWLNTSMSLAECRGECLKNCNCTAYANPYITNGGSGCLMWFGDLVDIRFTGDSKHNIYVRMPVSELGDYTSIALEKENKKSWPARQMVISIASGILVSGIINGGIFMMSRRKRKATERSDEDIELPLFKYATILAATDNFSRENVIGEGGFGMVYKGNLSSEGEIAVKRLSRNSRQGLEEFKNEVILISKLQHTNLIRLLGCCIEGEERILIYEYLQNKSLDYFVFDESQKKLLTWPKRFDIILGIARGLLYLHHDSRLKIIHRDLKTSNILLDGNLNPKISDFGLARTFGEDQPVAKTRRVVGTYGYMAPEYAIAGKFSVKSDVFSMGVVLLEIVSGKKNRGIESRGDHYHSLLGHAWFLWRENRILELMDDCLCDTFTESQVKRCIQVGLLCVQKFTEDRPEMSSVLFMLGTDGAILPEPKEPGFYIDSSSVPERSCTSPSPVSERNTMTITDLEAR